MNHNNLFTYLATKRTPKITLYTEKENESIYILSIEGRSIPENPVQFFSPIIEKIKRKIKDRVEGSKIIINLKVDYINSISLKFFMRLLHDIRNVFNIENVVVNWFYEDEDTYDLGKDLEFMTELDFNFVDMNK